MSNSRNNENDFMARFFLGAGALYGAYQIYKRFSTTNESTATHDNRDRIHSQSALWQIDDVQFYNRPHMNRVISHPTACKQAVKELRQHCREYPVLGLDCEWNSYFSRQPVALLQLATHKGLCFLFRLCEMECIPGELKSILSDPNIKKVGVEVKRDMHYLFCDYQAPGAGAVDLRNMAENCDVPPPHGLASLAKKSLGIIMDKEWQLTDWEAAVLTEDQIKYAANDARVAIELYKVYDAE